MKDKPHRPKQYPDGGGYYVIADVFQPRAAAGPNGDSRLELSTFGVDDLTENEIWNLGFDWYLPEERRLRGRSDVETISFLRHDLIYESQPPPPRHGSFIDWPSNEDRLLEITIELAANATVVPHPLGSASPRKPPAVVRP